jgi:hypothetical protein
LPPLFVSKVETEYSTQKMPFGKNSAAMASVHAPHLSQASPHACHIRFMPRR